MQKRTFYVAISGNKFKRIEHLSDSIESREEYIERWKQIDSNKIEHLYLFEVVGETYGTVYSRLLGNITNTIINV